MSTINVDNIAEYTSSGKINATHDIKMASGKSILNSDGYSTGAMVKLASTTASSDAAIIFDNFVDHDSYIHYHVVLKNIKPASNNVDLNFKFRVGGASGSDGTDTYRSSGVYYSSNANNSGLFSNESHTDYSRIHDAQGNGTNEGLSATCVFMPASVVDGASIPSVLDLKFYFESQADVLKTVQRTTFAYLVSTGLKFYMSSGNIASGEIIIYGVAK
jgi:hypothetical protein